MRRRSIFAWRQQALFAQHLGERLLGAGQLAFLNERLALAPHCLDGNCDPTHPLRREIWQPVIDRVDRTEHQALQATGADLQPLRGSRDLPPRVLGKHQLDIVERELAHEFPQDRTLGIDEDGRQVIHRKFVGMGDGGESPDKLRD